LPLAAAGQKTAASAYCYSAAFRLIIVLLPLTGDAVSPPANAFPGPALALSVTAELGRSVSVDPMIQTATSARTGNAKRKTTLKEIVMVHSSR
jgi:hypothetical protein